MALPVAPAPEAPKGKSPLEKHLQTALQGIIAALILWLGNTVNQAQLEIAKLGVQMETVRAEVARLQGQSDDRYTLSMAAADRTRLVERIQEVEARVSKVEPRNNR